MRLERRFTQAGKAPFEGMAFRAGDSEIRNPDGTIVFQQRGIEVPEAWSQVATDVLAQKYFRRAGVARRLKKVAEAEKLSGEPVSPETVLRLKHMIVSHHGEYEFGSPKLPMTLEAVALHQLDNLDAKLHAYHLLIRDDPNVDSPWTTYHANLGRKFYKGSKSD